MPTQDPTIQHPSYITFAPSWELMCDASAGEGDIKAEGTRYLPMKTGTAAIEGAKARARVYDLYRLRAEFPEIVAPTIRGAVGVMLSKAATVELPATLEHMQERASLDGLTLEGLHRRMATLGFAQLTWERNYIWAGQTLGVDLISWPELAMDPEISAQILVIGSRDGWFTGNRLSDYIGPGRCDYLQARRVINGLDAAAAIADLALEYEHQLSPAPPYPHALRLGARGQPVGRGTAPPRRPGPRSRPGRRHLRPSDRRGHPSFPTRRRPRR